MATVIPLNTDAPLVLTLIIATVALTAGFHPEMVPSSVAKMNFAGFPGVSWKSVVPLNTWPVGVPVELELASPVGTVTTRAAGVPVP